MHIKLKTLLGVTEVAPEVVLPNDPVHLLRDLYHSILNVFKYHNICIMVDPEHGLPTDDDRAWQVLAPLIEAERMLRIDGPYHEVKMAFHFFLDERFQNHVTEVDWIKAYPWKRFDLSWNADSLQRIITERLTQCSNRTPSYEKLAQLADELDLDKMLIEKCGLIPRHLVALANEVFAVHCRTVDSAAQPYITEQEVKEAFKHMYLEKQSLLVRRIAEGETHQQEFKSTLRVNMYTHSVDTKMEQEIAKTLCAFMNSTGGTLFVGVDDKGQILGLEEDLKQVKGKNQDGFRLAFDNLVEVWLDKSDQQYLTLQFHLCQDKEIAEVTVHPSKNPVYVKGESFFIRASASSRELKGRDMVQYIADHWSS
jgi:hypothetical protein